MINTQYLTKPVWVDHQSGSTSPARALLQEPHCTSIPHRPSSDFDFSKSRRPYLSIDQHFSAMSLYTPPRNLTLPSSADHESQGNADSLTIIFGVLATILAIMNIVFGADHFGKQIRTPTEDPEAEVHMSALDAGE